MAVLRAYGLLRELKEHGENVEYYQAHATRARMALEALLPRLKPVFEAANGRPIVFDGKLYRPKWHGGEIVDVLCEEAVSPFELELPDDAEVPDPTKLDLIEDGTIEVGFPGEGAEDLSEMPGVQINTGPVS